MAHSKAAGKAAQQHNTAAVAGHAAVPVAAVSSGIGMAGQRWPASSHALGAAAGAQCEAAPRHPSDKQQRWQEGTCVALWCLPWAHATLCMALPAAPETQPLDFETRRLAKLPAFAWRLLQTMANAALVRTWILPCGVQHRGMLTGPNYVVFGKNVLETPAPTALHRTRGLRGHPPHAACVALGGDGCKLYMCCSITGHAAASSSSPFDELESLVLKLPQSE